MLVRVAATFRRNGFTLVEMLVALFVFGLISAAGVALLRSTADSQIQLRAKLGDRATLSRLSNLIEADLAQVVPRSVRTEDGNVNPAFEAGEEDLFVFSRIGSSSDIGSIQPSLARITYRLDGAKLLRSSSGPADGARQGTEAVLIDGIRQATIRLRQADGSWREDWATVDAERLPRALELVLTTQDGRSYRMLFLVGAGPQHLEKSEGEEGLDA